MKIGAHQLDGPIRELRDRLEGARASDAQAEARAKLLGRWALACAIGSAVSLFLFVFLVSVLGATPLVVPPALLLAALALAIARARVRRYDVENRKLEAPLRLLRMLQADTPRKGRVALRLDLRDYLKGGRRVSRTGGLFSSVKTSKHFHEWLRLAGTLIGGTRYRLAVVDAIARKLKRKRKYTKIRERIIGHVLLHLRLQASQEAVGAVAEILKRKTPPRPLRLAGVSAQGQTLRVRLRAPACVRTKGRHAPSVTGESNLVTGDTLLQAMLWAYDGIGRSLAPKS